MSVSSPPCSPAVTLFYCMERFHREPLPFSQAVLGQYQRCAPELGRGQKLALLLGILLLLCRGQALPSDSSLTTGAGDRCHLAKPLPRNLHGPTLVEEVSHQCGPLAETLPSRCRCNDAPCSPSSQPGARCLSYHPWERCEHRTRGQKRLGQGYTNTQCSERGLKKGVNKLQNKGEFKKWRQD